MQSATTIKTRNSIPLYSLFIANAISLVGNVFSLIAIPWFVLQTTGSATQTGITGFFTILPVVLAGFLGGTLIGRLGYKRTSIIADLASGLTTAMIPMFYFTIGLEFWQLILGLLISANGGGAVIGGLLYAAIGHRLPRHATFVGAFVLVGFRFWVYAIYPPLTVLIVTTLITSIGAGPLNPIIGALEFERIPPNMRGRVFGAITAGAWIAMPAGMLLGGILTDRFGTFLMMIGLAVSYFLTTLSMAFIPAMKEMNRKADTLLNG